MQSILHVLFLPTPFKVLASATNAPSKNATLQGPLDTSLPEEVLLPGALYADCASVKLNVKVPEELVDNDRKLRVEETKAKGKAKGKVTEEVLDIPDDGEYGGELAGRLVWEEYEGALKIWEQQNPGKVEEKKATHNTDPPKDRPKASVTKEEVEDPNVY